MKIDRDRLVFADGSELYCNRGIVGLDPSDGTLTEGYDGYVDDMLLPAKRRELALHMIEAWKKYGGI